MSKTIIKDASSFEAIINNLEDSLKTIYEIFERQDGNFNQMNDKEVWDDDIETIMFDKYKTLSKNYQPICESLTNYIKFLKITLENYKVFESQMNKNIENNLDNLNVN